MSTIEELRQRANAAWASGGMAQTSQAHSALNEAQIDAWRCGECCGEQNENGWCCNYVIGQQRGWRYGYYYVGTEIMWAGRFCEHAESGMNAIRDYIWSPLLQMQLVKRLLGLVFGREADRNYHVFKKVKEMVEKTQLMEVKQITQQLVELRGQAAEIVDNLELALCQAEIVTLATQLVKKTVNKLAQLQGIPLGFEVDRHYAETELVGPLTEAAAMGVPFQGYAFGVVQGRFFCKVAGYEHLLKNKRNVSGWNVQIGDIEIVEEPGWIELPKEKHYKSRDGKINTGRKSHGKAKVEAIATITIDGKEYRQEYVKREGDGQIDGRISLDMKTGGEDSLQTRAKRRILKNLYSMASGHNQAPDADDEGVIEGSYTESPEAPAPAPQPANAATSSTTPQPDESRVSKMLAKFAELNVTVPQIRDRLKVDDLATIGEAEFSLLGTVYKAMTERGLTWEQTDE